ncbi:MAG: hypothetical protein EPO10_28505 [Reyranella sp.]|uniref:hypothetical protein n=1 Tax=Reyranella sp. TaxID=1929291 RepID=UPI001222C3E3|nr:hypothetical protein [Reyranella sp.]TAJ85501.1 MAG: hypothetical protein EPO41_26160 [Reyranella sp.]TBR22313.1 MAG: hypothetical protein EPO10_28505 [Reyranella sp.]
MTTTLMLLGHSHMHCIIRALRVQDLSKNLKWSCLNPKQLERSVRGESDALTLPEIQKLVEREIVDEVRKIGELERELEPEQVPEFVKQKDIDVVLCLRGEHYAQHGLTQTNPPYDFVLPGYETLPFEAGAQIVPYKAVYEHYERILRSTLDQISQYHTLFQHNLYHLEIPPPYEDNDYMSKHLHTYLARAHPSGFQIASPTLRFKLWRICSDIYRHKCESLGIKYVPVPSETMVDGRYLAPTYFDDGFHGNRSYGKQVVQNFILKVKSQPARASTSWETKVPHGTSKSSAAAARKLQGGSLSDQR